MDLKKILEALPLGKSHMHLSSSCWPWVHLVESLLELVPQVFYRIQIRTEGWPVHGSHVMLLQEVPGHSAHMGAGIILHGDVLVVVS